MTRTIAAVESGQRLRSLAVQPKTVDRYMAGYRVFEKFMLKRYQKSVGDVISVGELDAYFELFCDECFSVFNGRRRQMCVNALQGVLLVHGHQLKTLLPCSRRALGAWSKHAPAQPGLPLPQHWVDVIAVFGLLQGYGVLSLGFVVAFESYLRVGELCRLRGSDILVDGVVSSGSHGCGLRVRIAKTGRNQFARVRDSSVISILRVLKERTGDEELVFQGATPRVFNGLLKLLCQQLGLVQHFTMHSLRHGRASKGHLDREMPEHIRLDGRWASAKSMEVYLQAATSLLQTLQCPAMFRELAEFGPLFRSHLGRLYRSVPTRS